MSRSTENGTGMRAEGHAPGRRRWPPAGSATAAGAACLPALAGRRYWLAACTALLVAATPMGWAAPQGAQGAQAQAGRWPGIGRAVTPAEVRAWDIDVRPDFKGLPPGAGTVARGQEVWETKCASCHGVFGESNQVFTPIVGGTTAADMRRGHVATLIKGADQRSTMMKLSELSSLWDYINRAMPWTAPRSLTVEEVYAVTAYILNLADVVPADFTLSDANIAAVQNQLPNRYGMTTEHGMWKVSDRPDVRNVACMRDCPTEVKLVSSLPAGARGAHGNLAEQNRGVGPVRGVVTLEAATVAAVSGSAPQPAAAGAMPATRLATGSAAAAVAPGAAPGNAVQALVSKGACFSCHQVDRKVVGPAFKDVAAKYHGDTKAPAMLTAKIKAGGQGVWGAVPMPPAVNLDEGEIARLARWVLDGAPP